jgi:hypothetical protein
MICDAGATLKGRRVESPFDVYRGLFYVKPLVRAASLIPGFTGSGSVVVHTAPNSPVKVPLSHSIAGTPLIDSLPANGDLYLLDAAGKVGAKAIAGAFR